MKTLKKSLCLILALVFVLGLCTFGAGAAFTDDADIEYKDAVKVMEALEILVGPGDGSFQPKDNVTRGQAAKMITYMMLGKAAAEKLPAASAFDDVKESDWFAPYVNFCATKGIINGYGNGKYGPNDPVTALQLAKMLLVACGYGEMNEFSPKTWEINAFTYAVDTGIFDGVETADFDAPATREECALYVFNTLLWVDQVAYDVDYNDYKDKGYTFGEKVWKLVNTELNEDYCYVVATAETGADYSVVEITNKNGVTKTFYFANPIDKDLIGHQVQICYNEKGKKDADGKTYYQAYLIEDVSTVVSAYAKIGELTAALGNKAGEIADENGVPSFRYFKGYLEDTEAAVGFVDSFTATFGGNNFYVRANLTSNLASTSYFGKFVLDSTGDVISYVDSGTYTVAEVESIEEDYIVVSNADEDGWEIDMKYVNVEGLEEGDYVTIDTVGTNYYVSATSTKTTPVFAKSLSFLTFTWEFNYGAMFGGFGASRALGKVGLADFDDAALVTPGSTVTFYLDSHGSYFGLVIEESATDYGYAFFVDTYDVSVLEDGNVVPVTKALCVDEAGNAVSYKLNTEAVGYSEPTQQVYRVTLDNDGYAVLTPVGVTAEAVAQGFGKDRKIANEYYLAGGLKVFYVSAITSKNTVTVIESEVLPKGENKFYFYMNAENEAPVVWLYDVPAPATTANYMYVVAMDNETYANNNAGGQTVVNGINVCYYTTYINGATTLANILYVDETLKEYNAFSAIAPGFYRYSIDANGLYYLVTAGEDEIAEYTLDADSIHKGMVSFMSEDADLNGAAFYDVTDFTNSKGYRANVSTLDEVTALLKKGYTIDITFPYTEMIDGIAPVGTIYITAINEPVEP